MAKYDSALWQSQHMEDEVDYEQLTDLTPTPYKRWWLELK